MSTYSVDVKSTHLTSDGALFGGPSRVLSIWFVSDGAAGSIEILDNGASGTSLATFDTPIGSGTAGEATYYQIDIPGDGLYCPTSSYATLTNVDKVTIFYG